MHVITRLLLVMVFGVPSVSQAYIYRVHLMQQGAGQVQGKRVIALSDYHDRSHPSTIEQKIHLRDLLNQCKTCKAHVIVEDLSSTNTRGVNGCGRYLVNSRGGILGGLSGTCKRMDLEVSNLEYRFCRVAAFAPLLNSAMVHGASAHPSDGIYMHDVYEEILQQIDKIRSFNDGPLLNACYAQHIDQINNDMQELCGDNHKNMNITEYIHAYMPAGDTVQLLKKLLTFDSILFDLDLVHTIVNSDNTTLVVIAGGMHIENMCVMLEKVGYLCTYKTLLGGSVYNTIQYFKSMIGGGNATKPAPLDLKTVKPFIVP